MQINPAINNRNAITSVTGSIIVDLDEYNMTQPATWIPPGALPEAGVDYFWRVRVIRSSTGQIAVSPWSAITSFAVKPGFITKTPVQGIALLSPRDGCSGCPVKPASLSWTPLKETTRYEVVLAKDAEITQIVKRATTTTTAYEYTDALEYGKSYYWRVRALEIKGQSNIGDWSATFSFKAQPAPQPAQAPAQRSGTAPLWAWIVMAVGTVTIFIQVFILLRQSKIL